MADFGVGILYQFKQKVTLTRTFEVFKIGARCLFKTCTLDAISAIPDAHFFCGFALRFAVNSLSNARDHAYFSVVLNVRTELELLTSIPVHGFSALRLDGSLPCFDHGILREKTKFRHKKWLRIVWDYPPLSWSWIWIDYTAIGHRGHGGLSIIFVHVRTEIMFWSVLVSVCICSMVLKTGKLYTMDSYF